MVTLSESLDLKMVGCRVVVVVLVVVAVVLVVVVVVVARHRHRRHDVARCRQQRRVFSSVVSHSQFFRASFYFDVF
jgi:heme/copper-type cytochrome/quinol oxidase subunit 2